MAESIGAVRTFVFFFVVSVAVTGAMLSHAFSETTAKLSTTDVDVVVSFCANPASAINIKIRDNRTISLPIFCFSLNRRHIHFLQNRIKFLYREIFNRNGSVSFLVM